ncbi:hypothetical protein [Endozoicomonas ascidiicola]|uniref:hypothetical protein n=1 Tax=Endozoicomonas ascidiicola TaxID=1698521 RepID=UPI00082A4CDB|nr:hypothetical protein [Endozoicomonas ascidiicola]
MRSFSVNQLALAVVIAAYGSSTPVFAVENPAHIDLGPVEMTPMVSLGIGHDDNVYREGGDGVLADKSSTVYLLDASAAFKAQKGLSTYETVLTASNTRFASESDANYTDFGLTGNIHQELNSRHRLDLDFDLGRYHDAGSAISITDREAPAYTRTSGGAKYGFGGMDAKFRADFFGNINKSKYQKTNGVSEGSNRKNTEYGTTVYYRFMPKTDVLFEVKQRELDYTAEEQTGFDVNSYLLGLNWEATAKTAGYIKVGRRERDAQAAGVDTENFNGWEVGVSYMPVDRSVIQVSTSKDYGFDSENPDVNNLLFTKGTSSTVNWMHQWTAKISTNLNYTYSSDDVENRDGVLVKDRSVDQYGLSIDWNVLRNASLSLSYNNSERDESVKDAASGLSADSYKRNAYMLTGTIAL